jgi:hypothetical protein
MALPVTIPNEFASATASIPLSQLDTNFTTLADAVNGISDGSETLANASVTVITAGTANVTTLNTSGQVVFNDAGADVDFRVEGDTDANLLFVDASTDRVGIGTNTPDALLNVDGIASFGAGSASTPSIAAAGDLNTGMFFPAADTIAFAEGGAEAIRIDADGRLLIGNTSSNSAFNSAFQIQGSGVAGTMLVNRFNASTGGPNLYFAKSRSATIGTNTIVNSGDQFGIINFAGANGTGYDTGAQIYAEVDGTPGASGDMPGRLVFSTTPDGSDVPTERMRIDSSGNFLVGTTATVSGCLGSFFKASGSILGTESTDTGATNHLVFKNPNGVVGTIQVTGSATAYVTSSDYRLKENVAPMTGALAKVLELNPVTYTWKVDGSSGEGFIAHELQAVCPDAVSGEKDAVETKQVEVSPAIPATYDEEGNELTPAVEAVYEEREVPKYQGVDTSFLVATLTAAIQELKAELDEAKARIAALETGA